MVVKVIKCQECCEVDGVFITSSGMDKLSELVPSNRNHEAPTFVQV